MDLCILGMGEDGHTLSVFPGSPLLDDGANSRLCAAVDVPGKGTRLTYTPGALSQCGLIVVAVEGERKASTLHSLFFESMPVSSQPIRMLASVASRTLWLVDHAAAKEL